MTQSEGVTFRVPDRVRPIRERVRRFVDEEVLPYEDELERCEPEMNDTVRKLYDAAKAQGLWALGHPKDIGGQGLSFLDYAYVNEVIGRSHVAHLALGTASLQTAILLHRHAPPEMRDEIVLPLVNGDFHVAFALTEPDVAGSDPTGMQTEAHLDGDEWVINGRKWFISLLALSRYVVVGCRTEGDDVPPHKRFSMILVPLDTPGFRIIRDIEVMGLRGVLAGHYEIEFDNCRVPAQNLLGTRGEGFTMAQDRLGPGRIFHCMRWLGQAQRAFDLMCEYANSRMLRGKPIAEQELVQQMVFDSYADIQSSRLMVLDAAAKIDSGSQARVEIGTIKVQVALMGHRVVDRAIQVHGAKGVGSDTPLQQMYRHMRYGRIVDGPDEVHVSRVARYILSSYEKGNGWDFADS